MPDTPPLPLDLRTPDTETVEGTVRRVVFSNPESGWSVLRLAAHGRPEPITAVGHLPGVREGETLRLAGTWKQDPKYGRELEVSSYLTVLPTTVAGIRRYLGSGLVSGIGKVMADRLVGRFGLETLEVLEHDDRRLTEVPGIGPVRSARIRKAWAEQRGIREVMIFLQSHGIPPGHSARIFRRYGQGTLAALKENPYRLSQEVHGIGFLTADRIAGQLGIPPTSQARLAAGLLHVLGQAAEAGHVYQPRRELTGRAAALLGVEEAVLSPALTLLRDGGAAEVESAAGGEERWMLAPLREAEAGVARRVGALLATPPRPLVIDAEAAVRWFERRSRVELAAGQREAVLRALAERVLVITGGPGTGKTTLIEGIARILTRKARRVLLAAPTGRAAKRLSEATGFEAKTVHRLLEFDPRRALFQRHADNPLDCDTLIVDEASMLDCGLACHLLEALPDRAQLLLVGDVDQLPSVGPGKVLADLIGSGRVAVARLTEIFRQARQSLIVRNAHRVNEGLMPQGAADGEPPDYFFIERLEPEEILATVKQLVTERIPRGFGLDALRDIQVLTPMRRGLLGVNQLNQELQELLNPAHPGGVSARGLRPGDRVMQVRNNYDLDVFNGDVGWVQSLDPEGSSVVRFDGRPVEYEPEQLDDLSLAYACSVHKAQGSEYPSVVLPLHGQHAVMLQRNLLYTALTRARRLLVLVGDPRAVRRAVRNDRPAFRYTGLAERLRAQ